MPKAMRGVKEAKTPGSGIDGYNNSGVALKKIDLNVPVFHSGVWIIPLVQKINITNFRTLSHLSAQVMKSE